ncbi:MAG: heme anaerobic degradation radical SAM methyltransferase ChuW/HutW [Firmicutes bacterium]|nr:heme anaerobic degradation radical SAM methyltransferase ChuW/HutW [Bacillota bacterium]
MKHNLQGAYDGGRSLKEILSDMDEGLFSLIVGKKSDSPLFDVFDAKRVVHGKMGGEVVERSQWPELWQAILDRPAPSEKRSVYIHIPFCQKKCLYCGFFQNFCQEELETAYIDRLLAELRMYADSPYLDRPINAVFIGGGTPSALSPHNAGRMLKAIGDLLPLANDCELTLEGRIYDLVPEKMESWLANGVNRISLGVQSFDSRVRQAVGRLDDRETILRRLQDLSAYNQATVIIDLIYGLPYQSQEIWLEDIATLKEAAIDGWDLYQLNVYENSDLKKAIDAGRLPPAATTREQAGMYGAAHDVLAAWPVVQISVCHWSKTSRERNMYNIMSQQGQTMLPFGAGAGGKVGTYRLMLERDIKRYIQRIDNGEKPIMMMMSAPAGARINDAIKNQLKLGYLDLPQLVADYEPRLAEVQFLLDLWEQRGLLRYEKGLTRLTVAGQFWYVNLIQSLLESVNVLLHGEASWELQKIAAQG